MAPHASTSPRAVSSIAGHAVAAGQPIKRAVEHNAPAVQLAHARELVELGHMDLQTRNAVLCAAWSLALRCYSGQDHIRFELRNSVGDLASDTTADLSSTKYLRFRVPETVFDLIRCAKDSLNVTEPWSETENDQFASEEASEYGHTVLSLHEGSLGTESFSHTSVSRCTSSGHLNANLTNRLRSALMLLSPSRL